MPGKFPGIFFCAGIVWNCACIETAQVPQWFLFQPGSGGALRRKSFLRILHLPVLLTADTMRDYVARSGTHSPHARRRAGAFNALRRQFLLCCEIPK
jgi:hypothetical protein